MQIMKEFFYIFERKDRKNLFFLLILIFLMASLDVLGVASVMPFVSLLTDPEIIHKNETYAYFFEIFKGFGTSSIKDFTFFTGILLVCFLLFSQLFRAFTLSMQLSFVNSKEHSLGVRLTEIYLKQSYKWVLDKNVSELNKNILSEINTIVGGAISPAINIIVQTVIASLIIILLIIVNPIMAFQIGSIIILSYAFIFFLLRKFIEKSGQRRLKANKQRFKVLSEAFNGYKSLKLYNLEQSYVERFSSAAEEYSYNKILLEIFSQVPKFLLEFVVIGGMIIFILFRLQEGESFIDNANLIALYIFAGYKLMPALQQIYLSAMQIKFTKSSISNFLREIKLPICNIRNEKKLLSEANAELELKKINFYYEGSKKAAIFDINLKIEANSMLGIVGKSGSGKSTLTDIISGLLIPNSGDLFVNNLKITMKNRIDWQRNIGYVPQQIFLTDGTIESNIAYGVDKCQIDHSKIIKAAKVANIYDFIQNLEKGFKTFVGDNGVRMSGGEKQRIGIARAIYRNPKILLLDEATSALDNKTEKDFINTLMSLKNKMTVILIAHRLSTVRHCDKLIMLENGKIISKGTYFELSKENEKFQEINNLV